MLRIDRKASQEIIRMSIRKSRNAIAKLGGEKILDLGAGTRARNRYAIIMR